MFHVAIVKHQHRGAGPGGGAPGVMMVQESQQVQKKNQGPVHLQKKLNNRPMTVPADPTVSVVGTRTQEHATGAARNHKIEQSGNLDPGHKNQSSKNHAASSNRGKKCKSLSSREGGLVRTPPTTPRSVTAGGIPYSPRNCPRRRTLSVVLPPRNISSLSSSSVIGEGAAAAAVSSNKTGMLSARHRTDSSFTNSSQPAAGTTTPPPRPATPRSIRPIRPDKNTVVLESGPVTIPTLHFSPSYSAHKTHWIRSALENLGMSWIRERKITHQQLVSEEFEQKMSVLYDLAMAKKHEAIDRLVGEVQMEAERTMSNSTKPMGSSSTGQRRRRKQGAGDSINISGRGSATSKLDTSEHTFRMGKVQNRNFPFAAHFTESVKTTMSDALLRIMMREGEQQSEPSSGLDLNSKKCDRRSGSLGHGDQQAPGGGSSNNSEHDDHASSSAATNQSNINNKVSSNSFDKSEEDRSKESRGGGKGRSSKKSTTVVPCYVMEGGRLVVGGGKNNRLAGVGGSIVNKFGLSSSSRARRSKTECSHTPVVAPYFRRISNMMGFLPHELRIRYCRSPAARSLIVNGARPKRGDTENARQVREVIDLPGSLDVRNIVVLRTGKGSLIFEEKNCEMEGEVEQRGKRNRRSNQQSTGIEEGGVEVGANPEDPITENRSGGGAYHKAPK